MSRFDDDIALTRQADGYTAEISDRWNVHLGPNGGYIAALMLNGIRQWLGDGAPPTRAITYHFLSASKPGPARLTVDVEKLGRSLSTAIARLHQGERTIAIAIATFGSTRQGVSFCDFSPPAVTPPGQVRRADAMGPHMAGHAPFRDNYEQRLAIGPLPPEVSSRGHVGGWTRFRDRRPFDDLAMVAIADSWYPSFMARPMPQALHAPTVDYTVHMIRDLPIEGLDVDAFVLAEFETGVADDGYLVEDGRIWAPDGTLMAVSRQLAVLLPR